MCHCKKRYWFKGCFLCLLQLVNNWLISDQFLMKCQRLTQFIGKSYAPFLVLNFLCWYHLVSSILLQLFLLVLFFPNPLSCLFFCFFISLIHFLEFYCSFETFCNLLFLDFYISLSVFVLRFSFNISWGFLCILSVHIFIFLIFSLVFKYIFFFSF